MKKGWKLGLGVLCLLLVAFGVYNRSAFFPKTKKPPTMNFTGTPIQEKPFVIILPSFNNEAYCEKNLRSVFDQKYDNYRILFIDDASNDNTLQRVSEVITQCNQWGRTTIFHNEMNQGALANIYTAIHSCQDHEIAVILHGDDFLAHDKVLSKLNQYYANPNVWMTYGNFVDYPSYTQKPLVCKKFPKKVLRNNTFRNFAWAPTHLRSFYSGLFKKIPLHDLLYKGKFFPMANDMAYFMPMLEMAGTHAAHIREILYLFNRENPINNIKVNRRLHEECQNAIRKMKSYARLEEFKWSMEDHLPHAVDLIIFSYDRPMQLYALLESIEHLTTHTGKISVIYRISHSDYLEAYEEVKKRFPGVLFAIQSFEHPEEDFRPLVMQVAFDPSYSNNTYLAFIVDDMVVTDFIDFSNCVRAMQKTSAYGFYLAHGTKMDYCYIHNSFQGIPPLVSLEPNLFAWQFKEGQDEWQYPNSLDFVIYEKDKTRSDFSKMNFHDPLTLQENWALRAHYRRAGLFFQAPKCISIPLNSVNQSSTRHMNHLSATELLKKFQEGLKIDLSPLLHIENRSRHVTYEPTFIERDKDKKTAKADDDFIEIYQPAKISNLIVD